MFPSTHLNILFPKLKLILCIANWMRHITDMDTDCSVTWLLQDVWSTGHHHLYTFISHCCCTSSYPHPVPGVKCWICYHVKSNFPTQFSPTACGLYKVWYWCVPNFCTTLLLYCTRHSRQISAGQLTNICCRVWLLQLLQIVYSVWIRYFNAIVKFCKGY